MKALKKVVLAGWPDTRGEVSKTILEYWNYRDEIIYVDKVLLKGEKMIIPEAMRKDMLPKIHCAHLSKDKSKRWAQDVLFWPKLAGEIDAYVDCCNTCKTFGNQKRKETMIPHQVSTHPYEKVSTDLFQYGRKHFILVADQCSKFVATRELTD